jgi:antitoxin (DNA-binding transcriptional repressor) of toxin-antitoxin stability system
MRQMTVDQVAGDFGAVLNRVERDHEEILVVRDNQHVARIVPEPAGQTALEVLGDLYQALDTPAAEAWAKAIAGLRTRGTLGELRQSWGS